VDVNRKCSMRGCKNEAKFSTPNLKAWCSTECMMKYAVSVVKKEKQIKKLEVKRDLKNRKAALDDTVPNWTKKAQKAFNAYIRARDESQPCISCGKVNPPYMGVGGQWDCGHYRSVGSCPELRFEELNAHRQCKHCNSFLSGNVVEYRINLINRIGIDKLEWIEGNHELNRYRVPELKEIEKKFKKKLKELKVQHE